MTQFDQPTQAMELQDHELLNRFVFKDREELEQKFGMELERIIELYQSDKGRMELLEKMKEEGVHDGNVDAALQIVTQNAEQLQKKESFLTSVAKFPFRHPWITSVAALYTAYQFGFSLPAAIEDVLSSVPLQKMKDIIQSIGPVGGAVGELPDGALPYVPGIDMV